jgi:hypothetical protein
MLSKSKNTLACVLVSLGLLTACGGGGGGGGPVAAAPLPQRSATLLPLPATTTLGSKYWPDGSTATGGQGSVIGGVSCLVNENYHTHSHLTIIKNGQVLALPANIGLQGCAYELHTHDLSGIVHFETAAYHRVTLGSLFAVWGQPLSQSNVAGISDLPVHVYIDDGSNVALATGDITDIELTADRAITIVLGDIPKEIPAFTWASGF